MQSLHRQVRGALVIFAAIAATSAAPATAAPSDIVIYEQDRHGDVKLYPPDGITVKQKKSIDIRDVKVIDLGQTTRFLVHFPQITSSGDFDQMAFFSMRRPGHPQEIANVGFSPSEGAARASYAYRRKSGRYINCDPLQAIGAPKQHAAWVDVPNRCVPDARVRVSVQSFTGGFRTNERIYSRDHISLRRAYRLK